MTTKSKAKQVAEFLQSNPGGRYTAREIAENITKIHAAAYVEKRRNPRFSNDAEFMSQIVAEIGAHKDSVLKQSDHIFYQDKPRPRRYWYDPENTRDELEQEPEIADEENSIDVTSENSTGRYSEHDLYPILIEYLKGEMGLYCQRIDEKKSKNSRGSGGNQWLHPDLVAMEPIDKDWNDLVRSCVKHESGQSVKLWSFEVKIELNGSNVRKSFFQAVSNSSWANEGYLVATRITSENAARELRMLSQLHGIGVIVLNTENPSESDVVLPSKTRDAVDWNSVNRILEENTDFRDYIDLVSAYLQTGRTRARDWNKV